MKIRMVILTSILILLIGLVVGEHMFIVNTFNFMNNECDEIKNYIFTNEIINNENFIKKVNNFSDVWKQKENQLCLVVNHNDMEKVGEQIEKLKVLIKQNKKDEAEYEVQLLCFYMDGYENFIAVNFQNIF